MRPANDNENSDCFQGFMGYNDRDYYRDQNQFSPLAFSGRSIVISIILINVLIFVLDAFTPKLNAAGPSQQYLSHLLAIKSNALWQFWTFLTYGFTHASIASPSGPWHLVGNMLTLFFLGRAVEELLGRNEFLRFYLISIVLCGIGFTLFRLATGVQFAGLVGASGGVSAVVAVFIFAFPKVTLNLYGIIPIPAWLLGCLLLLFDFMSALNPNSQTAWEAHLIGFAFGAIYFRNKWNFSSWQFAFSNPLKGGPRLKVHDPDGISQDLQDRADQILQKISEHGESSLSARERKTLQQYSERLRNRNSSKN